MPILLYIDDDEGLARLVDRGLTRLGFKVVHAASGAAGLERVQQGGIGDFEIVGDSKVMVDPERPRRPSSGPRVPPARVARRASRCLCLGSN